MTRLPPIPSINYKARAERNLAGGRHITPSEKHSIALRKKLARGTKADPEPPGDCWECPKRCGLSLKVCREQSIIGRCPKCGDRYRYRITDKPWVACVRCRENGKV